MRAPELIGRHRTVARAVFLLASAGIVAGLASAALGRPAEQANVPNKLIFPIVGPASWTDDFGDPRPQGSHEGNDIVSVRGAPAVAVEAGKVKFWTTSVPAGCMLYLYGKSGTTYLYIHLNNDLTKKNDNRGKCVPGVSYARDLEDGDRVKAGQVIGFVGDSGDANGYPHLHFELHPRDGAAISPFRSLKRAERLLFVPPDKGTELLAASEQPTLALTGTVKKLEIATEPEADAEEPAPADDQAAAATETSAPAQAPPTGEAPVLIGRAADTTLLTIHVSSVELSTGGSWDVERDVTLAVPTTAVVEREKRGKVRKAKLESAETGESATVTTAAVAMTLRSQLARRGVLGAAHILLQDGKG